MQPHVVLRSTGVAALVIALAAACSNATTSTPVASADDGSDAGSDSTSPMDAAPESGACVLPGSFGSPKCNECVATHCCAPLAACEADPECRALRDCNLPCLDVPDAGGCAGACIAKHPDTKKLWYDIETCWSFSDPCGFDCDVGP
jgi:hypothetical protein